VLLLCGRQWTLGLRMPRSPTVREEFIPDMYVSCERRAALSVRV
jgi:hypothetical protein